MFLVIVLVVILSMAGGNRVESPVAVPPPPPTVPVSAVPSHDAPVHGQRSETAFLKEAEPMAKKLMEATCIEELLPLVRDSELTEVRMKRFYPDGKISPPGMSGFNTMSDVSHVGSIWTVMVSTRNFEDKPLFFVESSKAIKIDWESWVGWSEIPWAEFLTTKQSEAKLFRVRLSPVEYYNFAFADDKKWQAYWVESPDGKNSVYGYVERASPLNSKLRFPPEMKAVPLTLMLKFPVNATSSNQVIIDKVVAEGWVLETEKTP